MMVRRMASSVLCFEVLVILFFALVAMKLSDLGAGTVWAVSGPGMVLAALLCGMLRKPWAYQAGWVLQAGLIVAGGVFVDYLLAVRTRWGQDFENAALAGARQHRSGSWYEDADRWLNRSTAESFALALAVIAAVGLLRRRYLLALCGVVTAGGAVLG